LISIYLVPANEVVETTDGKTIRVEYREENGIIYKVFKFFGERFFFQSFSFNRQQKHIEIKN